MKSYILDPEKFDADSPQETEFGMECLVDNPLTAIIRIDTIGAQRNLSDPDKHDGTDSDRTRLSTKIRSYYDKYLDPEKHRCQRIWRYWQQQNKLEKSLIATLKTSLSLQLKN